MKNGQEKIQEVWRAFPHTFARKISGGKYQLYNYIKYLGRRIAEEVHRGGARIVVSLPPRHGKSELISNWTPTWFLDQYPDRRVILGSYEATFASKWGAKVRDNINSFPEVRVKLKGDSKAKANFVTTEGGEMVTAGVGGPMTGRGADLIIIDDPVKNWEEAQSEIIRAKHQDWFKSVARTRLEPGGSIIVLMTRWHEDDLAGYLLSGGLDDDANKHLRTQWADLRIPAIAEQDDLLGRATGEALCPERYDLTALQEIRVDLGEMIWGSMYQQVPMAESGNMVKKEWLRWFTKWPKVDQKIIVVDLCFKEGDLLDFACIEAWGRAGENIFLLDQIRARMDFPAQVEAIREMSRRHPDAHGKYIEEAANGAAVISTLRREILGMVPIKPKTSKEARLSAVAPFYQAGNVWYPDPQLAPWVTTNVNEILVFPNGKYDDTVDCATMALDQLGATGSMISRLEALNRM